MQQWTGLCLRGDLAANAVAWKLLSHRPLEWWSWIRVCCAVFSGKGSGTLLWLRPWSVWVRGKAPSAVSAGKCFQPPWSKGRPLMPNLPSRVAFPTGVSNPDDLL